MTAQPRCARGIYRTRYLSEDGHPMLVAVDSRGRRFYTVELQAVTDEDEAADMLEAILDALDPVKGGDDA